MESLDASFWGPAFGFLTALTTAIVTIIKLLEKRDERRALARRESIRLQAEYNATQAAEVQKIVNEFRPMLFGLQTQFANLKAEQKAQAQAHAKMHSLYEGLPKLMKEFVEYVQASRKNVEACQNQHENLNLRVAKIETVIMDRGSGFSFVTSKKNDG